MTTAHPTWTARAGEALRSLADRPGTLFLLVLALNALARPYANLCHDARLYSMQALNQLEGGSYADDLFLRFGSQDQFSLFSRAVAPVVAVLGLVPAFFLLYLVCNAVFVAALARLVYALIDDPLIVVLTVLFIAVVPLPFGGQNVFVVEETFLTPRLLANALVLFALERLLRHRFAAAFALIVAAMLLHPLMAFAGLLVWAGYLAATFCRGRTLALLTVAAAVVGLAVLAYEPLGVAVFGRMDDEWRGVVRDASAYNFPDEWTAQDWLNVAVSLAVPLLAIGLLAAEDVRRRRLLLVAACVGAVGLLGTVAASYLPYALLFQGQPYRALWILKVLQVPFGFLLIRRWSASASRAHQLAAVGLLFFFSTVIAVGIEPLLPLFVLVLLLLRAWALREDLRAGDRLWRIGAASVIGAAVLWSAFKWLILFSFRDELFVRSDALEFAQRFIDNLGPCAWLLALAALAARLCYLRPVPPAALAALVVAALAYQGFAFVVANDPEYRARHTRYGADVAFVKDFLADRHPQRSGALPTVYCAWGRADFVWVDLHSKSYFDWAQVVGVLFNRHTALEGRRRAALVSAFELERFREEEQLLTSNLKRYASALFQADLHRPAPTRADLARLCQEPGLDYVIVPQEFPGLHAASNGHVFVYDCSQVRAALRLPGPDRPLAAARRELTLNIPLTPLQDASP